MVPTACPLDARPRRHSGLPVLAALVSRQGEGAPAGSRVLKHVDGGGRVGFKWFTREDGSHDRNTIPPWWNGALAASTVRRANHQIASAHWPTCKRRGEVKLMAPSALCFLQKDTLTASSPILELHDSTLQVAER